jgi:hypothetical protein
MAYKDLAEFAHGNWLSWTLTNIRSDGEASPWEFSGLRHVAPI